MSTHDVTSDGDDSRMRPGPDSPASDAQFARLVAQHQSFLFGYLVNCLGDFAAAEDVLQETFVVLWTSRDKFQLGTNFAAWSTTIALNQVRKYRRGHKRRPESLSEEILEIVAGEGSARRDESEQRRAALRTCLEKLNPADRELVERIYGDGRTVASLADESGTSLNVLYKSTRKIRRALHDCIQRANRPEGGR